MQLRKESPIVVAIAGAPPGGWVWRTGVTPVHALRRAQAQPRDRFDLEVGATPTAVPWADA